MADKKKSQLELEKSIKKAAEGIELFDAAYSKYSSSSARNIREKNESELKREIKKLQKLRESFKTAISLGDFKETSSLVKTNNEIEARIAKMRNLDKDQRLPEESQQKNEQMRQEFKDWLADTLKKLQKKTSKIPTEKEKHKGPYKTKKIEREKQKKLSELDLINNRHQFHIKNLNKLLQSFPNNSLNIDELNYIKVYVEDYMTNCEDSEHTFSENFYDVFDMELPTIGSPAGLTHSNVSAAKSKAKDNGQQTSSDAPRKNLKGTTSADEVHKSISKANSANNERVNIANPATNASIANQNNVAMSFGTPSTPEKFRDKPSSAVTPSTSQKTRSVKIQSTVSLGSVSSSPHPSTEKVKDPKSESSHANSTAALSGPSPSRSHTVEDFSTPSNEVTKKVNNKQHSNAASTSTSSKQKPSDKQTSGSIPSKAGKSASSQPTLFDMEEKKSANIHNPHSISCSDTDSVTVATEIQRSSKNRLYTTEDVEVLSILERAWANFSNFENTDCHGKNTRLSLTHVQVPAHHRHPHDENMACPEMFEKYSIETLFFIFYFFQGTQAQLMAGKMLKKRSWGFHTDFMLWFQRHEEPRVITDTYEQGAYKFFDIHTWSLMKKDDFVFEYRYLEGKDF